MKNQWIRILIAGIGAQVLYYVFLYTILSSWGGAFSVLGLISMFVLHFVGGFWAVIKTKSKFKAALNGAFVGIVSIITFFIIVILLTVTLGKGDGPPSNYSLFLFLLSHLFKIFGGALGGYVFALKSK